MYGESRVGIEKLSSKNCSFPQTLVKATGIRYPVLAVLYAVAMYSVVFVVERIRPWRQDVSFTGEVSLDSYAWPPYLSGAIVGLLQLPLNGLLGKMIGTSASYMAICGNVHPVGDEMKESRNNLWQVFLGSGAILGSFLASFVFSDVDKVQTLAVQGAAPLTAFIGGVLLLLGAKMMHGCTSGHGLSGMALLAIPSMVATCCIFIGGIVTGVLLNHLL